MTSKPFDDAGLVDYAKSLDCIHCGLCLQTCPTFRLTGVETSSPRGRIHLMRAVGEGRLAADEAYAEELDFCLLCRHCESVCPAGVRFGSMMEFARGRPELETRRGLFARLARHVGFRRVLPSRLLLRLAGSALRVAQVLRLTRLGSLFGTMGRGLVDLPAIESLRGRRLLPRRVAPAGEPAGEVALLEGCVMPELYPRVNRATARSLARLGFAVNVPPEVVCCGSLQAHNGDPDGARDLARRLIAAFEKVRGTDGAPTPLVVNSAGCGAHLRELDHLFEEGDPWRERAAALAERVVDYSELVAPELEAERPLRSLELAGKVTFDDPCHLCHGQGVRRPPREVLDRLPGLERVELPDSESCCGSAGIYSLLRPADSQAVFAPKERALASSGADTLVTANPGCQLQWEAGLRRAGSPVRVVHLAELVDAALAPPPEEPA